MEKRVTHMERCMDIVQAALRKGDLSGVQKHIRALKRYQESGQWLQDYDSDARGEFPQELKRGVLSQDALYDLLCEVEEKEKS